MRQVRFDEYGGSEVLHIEEAREPEPGPGELLVATEAIGATQLFRTLKREETIMHVMAVSTVSDQDKFWSGLKKAHAKLPEGATWKVAVASKDGAKAVNIITHDSIDGVRDFFEAHARAYATTEYFEADAANAVGLPR